MQARISQWAATVRMTLITTSLILRLCNWLMVGLAAAREREKREIERGRNTKRELIIDNRYSITPK